MSTVVHFSLSFIQSDRNKFQYQANNHHISRFLPSNNRSRQSNQKLSQTSKKPPTVAPPEIQPYAQNQRKWSDGEINNKVYILNRPPFRRSSRSGLWLCQFWVRVQSTHATVGVSQFFAASSCFPSLRSLGMYAPSSTIQQLSINSFLI